MKTFLCAQHPTTQISQINGQNIQIILVSNSKHVVPKYSQYVVNKNIRQLRDMAVFSDVPLNILYIWARFPIESQPIVTFV